jgi:localization factor PodJL
MVLGTTMVRAYPASSPQDYDPQPPAGEWQALRGELVALLDQVESQVARSRRDEDPEYRGVAERMRQLRYQVSEPAPEPEQRHREALRSVRRAVDRFNERDDGYAPAPGFPAQTGYAPNPRDTLQSAISQIRARHGDPLPMRAMEAPAPAAPPVAAPPPRVMDSPRFDELASAVGGISGRLERLETELKSSAKSQTGNVKEIAEQVAQLSHVVELLAGAVGETGQVKRLESQIAGLAKLVAQGPQIDFSGLTKRLDDLSQTIVKLNDKQKNEGLGQRLDDVTATIGRLADLQVQFANRVDNSAKASGGLREGIVALEQGIRGVYERIEGTAQSSDGLRDGMASIENAIRAIHQQLESGAATPDGLATIEDGIRAIYHKLDASAPSAEGLAAIENSLRGIHERLETTPQSHRDGMAAIEASIRELSARLETPPGSDHAVRVGLTAVENGIRGIYDRIDAMERSTAMPPMELDRLTEEMAGLTAALRNPAQSEGVVELVEGIYARIAAIESPSLDVGELKLDMQALRGTVIEAMEPRFAALEMQIESLSDRMAEPRGDVGVGQLEAQVRQLVARMDQTGEQLTGLARLYAQPTEREPAPDFEALADMVAARTSEAVAAQAPMAMPMMSGGGIDAAGIDEIERRVSRLMNAAAREKPADDLTGIEGSIREVSARLARLENSLAEQAQEAERLAAMPPVPTPEAVMITAPATSRREAATVARAPVPAAEEPVARNDAMPADPSVDAPLRDRPFGDDPSPLKSALDAKNGPRKRHPGLSYEPLPDQGDAGEAGSEPVIASEARPSFDPDTVVRPPRPVSAFETAEREAFARPTTAAAEAVIAEAAATTPTEPPSTNTFIAAARRAAQRQNPAAKAAVPGGSGSLIARAFSTFQASKSGEAKPAAEKKAKEKPAKPIKPIKVPAAKQKAVKEPAPIVDAPEAETAPKPKKAGLFGLGKKVAPVVVAEVQGDIPPAPVSTLLAPEPIAADHEATAPSAPAAAAKESFLSKHRRPILLGASVVAIAFLTINLIGQRLGEEQPVTRPAPSTDTSAIAPKATALPLSKEPVASQVAAISGPRVVPIVDSSATTASIDPAAAKGFTAGSDLPAMPAAFAAVQPGEQVLPRTATPATEAIETAALPPVAVEPLVMPELESPVTVELPPESLGPEPLRTAAANGDARAQFEIAAIYTEGRAVTEDLAAAAVWYERAAAQGFAPAQYRLGNLYENGRGVARDLQQARLWYQRAAEAGNRMAMHNLAALYASGELGKQEFDSAAAWFEQAARRGMRDSQFNLGMLYARGLGVEQSLEQSYKWFSLAAQRGDGDAAKARDDVARSLDAETVSRLNDELAAFAPASIDLVANFAPIGTWSEAFDPGEAIGSGDVVKSVQLALAGLGYDVGTPDGLMGPKTAEAIRTFERTTGMSESGTVNPRLLAVLGSQPV